MWKVFPGGISGGYFCTLIMAHVILFFFAAMFVYKFPMFVAVNSNYLGSIFDSAFSGILNLRT